MCGSKKIAIIAIALMGLAIMSTHAQEPGWTSGVIKRGNVRTESQNTHILRRPYRPFHFYGNTVRRMHYQNRLFPSTEELRKTVQMLNEPNDRSGRRSSNAARPAPPANTFGPAAPTNSYYDTPPPLPTSIYPTPDTDQSYQGFRVRQSSLTSQGSIDQR